MIVFCTGWLVSGALGLPGGRGCGERQAPVAMKSWTGCEAWP